MCHCYVCVIRRMSSMNCCSTYTVCLVVMSSAYVRSCSFIAVFPVLGRLEVYVRAATDVVVTLRVVRSSCGFVVMPHAVVFVCRRIPHPGKASRMCTCGTDVIVTLRVARFSCTLVVMIRAFVRLCSSSPHSSSWEDWSYMYVLPLRMLLSRCALYGCRIIASLCHARMLGRLRSRVWCAWLVGILVSLFALCRSPYWRNDWFVHFRGLFGHERPLASCPRT